VRSVLFLAFHASKVAFSFESDGATSLQRLFSIFPNGWPGAGLVVLRLGAGVYLLANGLSTAAVVGFQGTGLIALASTIPGCLLLIGLWTPIAGILAMLLETTMVFTTMEELKAGLLLLCICAAIAMLGPGCWSIDSILFGRRRLDITSR
jgi:putative oxidoreductase